MYFIVAPVVTGAGRLPGGITLECKEAVTFVYSNKEDALRDAQERAKKQPGVQYGVFTLTDIAEAKATLVSKTVDDHGQIVVGG